MPTTIDALEISISARAKSAETALNNLIDKLGKLDSKLSLINGNSLNSLSQGIDTLSKSMSSLNNSDVKTQDFTRLASNIEKLSSINDVRLLDVAEGLHQITYSFSNLAQASQSAQQVTDLLTAIARLGYASMDKAISNMPRLSSALREMLTSLSTVPAINDNLIQMTNAVANLASQGGKVRSAASNLTRGMNGISNSAEKTTSVFKSLSSAFGTFYQGYFWVIRGIKGIWKSIESSMDYIETYNYLNVSVKKMGEKTAESMGEVGKEAAASYADQFRKTLVDLNEKMTGYTLSQSGALIQSQMSSLGLNPEQLQNFQAKIGAMTTSVGLLGETSSQAQEGLSMLAADLSSLTNTDLETTMSNLTSGLMGMSRALYKYGIDITNASLAETAASLGIEKKVSAMSQAEKMQLRLLTILKNSDVAWGDQARTIDSVANQYRIFKQQISNLGRVFGNLFIPIVQYALPVINGLIVSLQNLFQMLGFELHGQSWLDDVMTGVKGGAGDIEGFGEGVDDLGDSLDGAAASAKKLKQQLQGFDELNVLSTKDNNGLSTVGGLLPIGDAIQKALDEYKKKWSEAFEGMDNEIQKWANHFNDIFEPIKSFWSNLVQGNFFEAGSDLSLIVTKIFDGLTKAIEQVDWETLGKNIGTFLEGINWEDIMTSVGKTAFAALKAAISLWSGMFEKDPVSTLAISFAAFSFMYGKSKLTKGTFSSAIGSALGLSSSGVPFSFVVAATLAVTWGLKHEITDSSSMFRKKYKEVQDDLVKKGYIDEVDKAKQESAFDSWSWSEQLKSNWEEIKKGWSSIFDFGKKKSDETSEAVIEYNGNLAQSSKYGIDAGLEQSWNSWEKQWQVDYSDFYNDVEKKFSKKNWVFDGVKDGLSETFDFSRLSNLPITKGISIKGYATGGFPSADLFFANEYGVPELVGTVGGKTAVANNTEITGISDAVYSTGETQAGLLQTAVGLLQVIASNGSGYDSERVFNDVRRNAYNYTARTGNPAFPI